MLLSPDAGLDHIPMVQVPDRDREAVARGQIIRVRGQVSGPVDPRAVLEEASVVRVMDERGSLVAMGHVAKGRLYPDKVFISPRGAVAHEQDGAPATPARPDAPVSVETEGAEGPPEATSQA